jgi:hypothetical protein
VDLVTARKLPAFRTMRPDDPIRPVDRYTIGHGMIGFLLGLGRVPWWAALGIAVGWELIENPLKRAMPEWFPVGVPDTIENASIDVAAWMAGYGAARLIPRDRMDAR